MKMLRRQVRMWRMRRWEKRYLEQAFSPRRHTGRHRRSLGDRFDIFPA
jgi:hypothetical protein